MSSNPVRAESGQGPAHVVVVGAGMVGLSTAWFLQERGVEVTVLDRSGVAAGSSWGNAGWISPGLAIPLAEPSVLRYGMKAMFDPDSPLYVPPTPDPQLLGFMLGFARRCTMKEWRKAMAAFVPVNEKAIGAYDALTEGGVSAQTHEAPIMAAFRRAEDAAALEREIDLVREAGLELAIEAVDNATLRAELPIVSPSVEKAIRIGGQRYLNPGEFADALAKSVENRGGRMLLGYNVRALRHGPGGVTVEMVSGEPVRGDAVVLATGAWLPELARPYGVRVRLVAGRGYSFSARVEQPPVPCPVYFPQERVACTPIADRLRIGGTMEIGDADDVLHIERIDAMVRAARPLLTGVDLDDRKDSWVGGRPVTADNLPLIGPTHAPGVWTAGGHGMWGITQGPITGQLLAEYMTTGRAPAELRPFDPTR
ncbi:MAG TPA: FAD-dependent oxidoreductase [Segeticoccus sp.]|uniref:NAD(P)/FAD-dependent oxidoreductase n=1 Tax=Segeticoccus sp. TaxID=2706531 RepID=UPI002D7F9F75|nr:FAD-dependent oxidoreductase [Segeticoccus sp.]HET8599003.1 FAD-dependent oxidoreductase [Segeticoccus sp.]